MTPWVVRAAASLRRVAFAAKNMEIAPPWSGWRKASKSLPEWSVIATDDAATTVPQGYREVGRGEILPVSEEERLVATARFGARTPEEADDLVRMRRCDPGTHDWYVWVAPLSLDATTAPAAWVAAADGAIGTEHSHVVVRQADGGWLSWAGLGSHMIAARRSADQPGKRRKCVFATREDAIAGGVALVRDLRRKAVERLQTHLAGWDPEAVDARLSPPALMRFVAGWVPATDIAIHEPADDPGRYPSSWSMPVTARVPADAPDDGAVPDTFSEHLRALVREEMARRHLDQRSLARMVGVHEAIISRWLNGVTAPRPEVVDAVAAALGIGPRIR